MAKKNYKNLAVDIVDKIGRVDNIESVTHCMTRLRFKLKNESSAKTEEIKALDGVLAVVNANGQYQVVIGNDVVNVFNEVTNIFDVKTEAVVDDEASKTSGNERKELKQYLASFIDYVTGTMTQILPILIGAGLLSVSLTIATKVFGVSPENSTYQIFNFVYNAGFYYLPIYVGFAASRKLNGNPFITAMIGVALLHPNYVGFVGEGVQLTMFGTPFKSISYGSTVIPMLLIAFVSVWLERGLYKVLPNVIKSSFAPLLQLVIMIPISLLVLGPLGYTLGSGLVNGILWMYEFSPLLIVPIVGMLWPILVMLGAHTLLVPTMTELIAVVGYDAVIKPGGWVSNFVILGVCLAVAFKSKKHKATAVSASISTLFGVTEPAIYGIVVPMKKTLVSMVLGSFIAGIIAGFVNLRSNILVANSILSIVMFNDTIVQAFVVTVLSIILGFVITLVIGFDEQ